MPSGCGWREDGRGDEQCTPIPKWHALLRGVPVIEGFNHLTLSVADLERSVVFYRDVLGFSLAARWAQGAYLEAGALWLCLSPVSAGAQGLAAGGYTHYAFSVAVDAFPAYAAGLRAKGVREWRDNSSEGDSLYLLDPDGHRLEVHAGTLASRLAHCRRSPYAGMAFGDPQVDALP